MGGLSCEEAEEAGEQRVQGSSGSGRGFPQAKFLAPATVVEWSVRSVEGLFQP